MDNWRRLPQTVIRNFCLLSIVCCILVSSFAVFLVTYMTRILDQEIIKGNENLTDSLRQRTTQAFEQSSNIAAYLSVDSVVRSFFSSDKPGAIYEGYYGQLQRMLAAYTGGITYIDSVYLYSPVSHRIISSTGEAPRDADLFSDNGWLSRLEEQADGYLYFLRSVEDRYPHLYSVLLHKRLQGVESVVLVNINLQTLFDAVTEQGESRQYLVGSDSKIILKRIKTALVEELESEPGLEMFDPQRGSFSHLGNEEGAAYVYTQIQADKYGFYCVSVTPKDDYWGQISYIRTIVIVAACGVAVIGCIFAFLFSLHVFRPVKNIMALLDSPDAWIPGERTDDEVRQISERIVAELQTNAELRERLNSQLEKLSRSQMQALRKQLSPHFLFNTLNFILWQTIEDTGSADCRSVEMIDDLAYILRYALESTDLVPLRVEEGCTERYFRILLRRYNDAFDVQMEFDDEIREVLVPRLLFQPLIENAVFHGVSRMKEEKRGFIGITGRRSMQALAGKMRDTIRIVIEDNGKGMGQEELKALRDSIAQPDHENSEHIGMQNVATRLKLLYSECYSMSLDSETGRGTRITIEFPMVMQTGSEKISITEEKEKR